MTQLPRQFNVKMYFLQYFILYSRKIFKYP